jgi:hypothetical protein
MRKHSEKELDLAIAAKLENDPAFLQYLLERTSFRDRGAVFRSCRSNHPWGSHPYPQKDTAGVEAIVNRQSETDVLLTVTAQDGEVLGVHIENKIGPGRFTADQPEMYEHRAKHWVGNPRYGAYTDFDTVLIAPAAFIERNAAQSAPFGARFTHEEIAVFVPEFGSAPRVSTASAHQFPPCSFGGDRTQDVSVGHRAMICGNCKEDLRLRLLELGRAPSAPDGDYLVAGAECVVCDKILTTARFSLRRWIFGICDGCACSMTATSIEYAGSSAKGYEF